MKRDNRYSVYLSDELDQEIKQIMNSTLFTLENAKALVASKEQYPVDFIEQRYQKIVPMALLGKKTLNGIKRQIYRQQHFQCVKTFKVTHQNDISNLSLLPYLPPYHFFCRYFNFCTYSVFHQFSLQ